MAKTSGWERSTSTSASCVSWVCILALPRPTNAFSRTESPPKRIRLINMRCVAVHRSLPRCKAVPPNSCPTAQTPGARRWRRLPALCRIPQIPTVRSPAPPRGAGLSIVLCGRVPHQSQALGGSARWAATMAQKSSPVMGQGAGKVGGSVYRAKTPSIDPETPA